MSYASVYLYVYAYIFDISVNWYLVIYTDRMQQYLFTTWARLTSAITQ